MTIYSILMTLFLLFMLAIAGYKFLMERDPGIFFYHELLLPVHQNAIYISGFTYISFCFILFEGKNLWPSQQFIRWRSAWLMLLFCFLLLLSSKLIISITFVTLIIAFYRIAAEKKRSPLILTVSLIIFSLTFISSIILTPPINKRFKEIIQTDYKKITQEKFDPNTYFSGLEFRLLLWRFGFDIAEHENTLLFGVGPSNSQPLLQKKYLEMNMYSGEKGTDNVGYLSFNYHNQYLQTLVDSGLVGLAVLLLLCASMVKMAFSSGTVVLKCISLLIIIMFLTESMLERQYGIILTLVPYLIYYPSSKYKTSKYAYTTSIPQTP
ncbi:O-antigen ligase family protein [Parasegetibacter sp. NRK P23]|uniref:O-antigen ligase family protein n=1 Tax=Parasegetibacter sp. NRK P23 TaxID=2942999 RepID=UPI002043EDB4|nr:O-antigen ligase family protein [Parasegetibacter sp. NRK P23]MCM5527518.1 O-antigen ligase family protein [Parasegetibacter sp. NRK P23]